MDVCLSCGVELPTRSRQGRPRAYCSAACRQKAYRLRASFPGVPLEMVRAPRWVRRVGKRPVRVNGRAASSTSPGTWATFSEVAASDWGSGFGFMLGDGFACIDLDNAVNEAGRVKLWAREVLELLPGGLVERSLSGTGLHVYGKYKERPGACFAWGDGRVEFYSRARFIAMTGDFLNEVDELPDFAGGGFEWEFLLA